MSHPVNIKGESSEKAKPQIPASYLATPPTSPGTDVQPNPGIASISPQTPSPIVFNQTPPQTPDSSPPILKARNLNLRSINESSLQSEVGNPDILQIEKQIGEGLWSKVYRVKVKSDNQSNSAAGQRRKRHSGQPLAIKVARDRFSQKVLLEESRILASIHLSPNASAFIVPFHGWNEQLKGIVMDEMPLTLQNFTRNNDLGETSKLSLPTFPGIPCLATDLVDGLHFLHENRLIHADIKPSNILLRPIDVASDAQDPCDNLTDNKRHFQPYYADFSASITLRTGEDTAKPHNDAGASYDYMAPELFSLVEPDYYPSIYSDVYALGVTLLSVILGCSPYEGIPSGIMRRTLCKEGRVLSVAQDRFGALRYDTDWLVGALRKHKSERWQTSDWQNELSRRGWTIWSKNALS